MKRCALALCWLVAGCKTAAPDPHTRAPKDVLDPGAGIAVQSKAAAPIDGPFLTLGELKPQAPEAMQAEDVKTWLGATAPLPWTIDELPPCVATVYRQNLLVGLKGKKEAILSGRMNRDGCTVEIFESVLCDDREPMVKEGKTLLVAKVAHLATACETGYKRLFQIRVVTEDGAVLVDQRSDKTGAPCRVTVDDGVFLEQGCVHWRLRLGVGAMFDLKNSRYQLDATGWGGRIHFSVNDTEGDFDATAGECTAGNGAAYSCTGSFKVQ